MYQFFIGIDVSKNWINVACCSSAKINYAGQFANTTAGYDQMVTQLANYSEGTCDQWLICLEKTGSYSKKICRWLWDQGIAYREEDPLRIQRSTGLSRGKSDRYDARDICRFAYQRRDTIEADIPDHVNCYKIKKLLSRRDFLVRQKRAAVNTLKDQQTEFDQQTYQKLKIRNEQLLEIYNEQIREVEGMIRSIINEDQALRQNDALAQSVIGIGPVTSAALLAFTNNYKRFENARELASYVSIAPFPYKSGTSINGGDQVHPFGNKFIKTLLSNGVQNAIRHDNQLKIYFNRKIREGKATGKVINAIKNKLIQRVYAVIKRQSPYVPLANYA